MVDRAQIVLSDERGRQLYDGTAADTPTVEGAAATANGNEAPQASVQGFDIPMQHDQLVSTQVSLEMRDSLTLMRVQTQFAIAALDGREQGPGIGHCATRLEGDAIKLSCVQLRHRPICLSAVLYGPSGEQNPEVLKCDPDYRPLPAGDHKCVDALRGRDPGPRPVDSLRSRPIAAR